MHRSQEQRCVVERAAVRRSPDSRLPRAPPAPQDNTDRGPPHREHAALDKKLQGVTGTNEYCALMSSASHTVGNSDTDVTLFMTDL